MSTGRVILVTGANRGLGYAILQVAGARNAASTFIMTSRKLEAGQEAAAKLVKEGVKAKIEVIPLDVTNDDQILETVKFVEEKHGKLDVLVNNAGIISFIKDQSLPELRRVTNEMLDVNLTSVAVISTAFQPLLHKAENPKVINITSGLGSIANAMTKKMVRYPPYGASKVGMNGVTAHMQSVENDRIAREEAEGAATSKTGRIRFYSVAPGLLNTAFTHYAAMGKDPKDGAEVVVQLIMDDQRKYPGGTQWEFEEGQMREVPW
ncbi:uncharacterized oxidoreductase YxjF [Aspergillus lentulus]|uniref:Uncharacterized oxidoreductase YxjF n=1 Tax=Aspergillus lentulus TaxID=293939 RepID=A0AAN4PRK6_ASPLE|nr:uncharacterized oxidoreductase YxjF [Aspergillus lentulus]